MLHVILHFLHVYKCYVTCNVTFNVILFIRIYVTCNINGYILNFDILGLNSKKITQKFG